MLFVSPGGVESLRPSEEARSVRRTTRVLSAALRAQVPLILIACPAADDIFTVRKSRITDAVYKHFKVPLPFAKGRRGTPVPKPIALTHYVAPPLVPPTHDPANEEAQIDALHAEACAVMQGLLNR